MISMATKRLRRVGLSEDVQDRLKKHNLTICKDVLNRNQLELLKILGTTLHEVRQVVGQVSMAVRPSHSTALDLYHVGDPLFFATDLPHLDRVLHGGLPKGTITEIAGPSGCGKTQFCVMLSVLGTLPHNMGGLNGAVMYIDTEAAFSPERLIEVAKHRFPDYFSSQQKLIHLSSNVHIYHESTCKSLLTRLQSLEHDLITKGVKLLVLDSIASLIRKEFDSQGGKNLTERTNVLAKQGALLKYIAESFKIPVVVTNQITTRFGKPLQEDQSRQADGDVSLDGDGGYVTAALGNTWSHSVNTRLIVQYLTQDIRQVLVAKSPVAPFANFLYTIESKGIVLKEQGTDCYAGTDPGLQHIRVRSALPQGDFQY